MDLVSNRRRVLPRGERLRLALQELGPIFIKFGQALSTRRDLLPADIADELAKLQDRVPPFASSLAVAALEATYGKPLADIFGSFEAEPLAAAYRSHRSTPQPSRPAKTLSSSCCARACMKSSSWTSPCWTLWPSFAHRYWVNARRLRPMEVVQEYRKTILDELDLMREAANAAQLKRNFAGSSLLYVPEVYWDLCRTNVMVMERIHGIIVSRVDELRTRGANIAKLAENGVEIFFTQVFRHNFFHADMHPGNIFVQIDDPENPRYAAIDFGIVGTLQPRDQHYLAENFLAFFNRDYARVAALHIESGWVPAGTRVDELESAVRTVCEPIFHKPLKEISFAQVLLRLFETARRFDMKIQPQLILLQKTLLNIEGLGRELYPELDLWKTAQPILQAWMLERMSPRAVFRRVRVAAAGYDRSLETSTADLSDERSRACGGSLQAALGRECNRPLARGLEAQRRAARRGCRCRRAVAVRIAVRRVVDASSVAGLGTDGRRARLGGLVLGTVVEGREIADRMRISVESQTSYRGRNSRPNWLALFLFIGIAMSTGALNAFFSPGLSAAATVLVRVAGETSLDRPQQLVRSCMGDALYPDGHGSLDRLARTLPPRPQHCVARLRGAVDVERALGAAVFRRQERRRRFVLHRCVMAGRHLDASGVFHRAIYRRLAADTVSRLA